MDEKKERRSIGSEESLMVTLALLGYEAAATLDDADAAKRNTLTCALIGHSRIQTYCFGYFNCARCGDQLGDTLASIYPGAKEAVVVGHDCSQCRENAETLTWRDTVFAPEPFPAKAALSISGKDGEA